MTVKKTKEILGEKTIDFLKQARLIFLRSVEDTFLIRDVLGERHRDKFYTFPDLGYLCGNLISSSNHNKKYITIIQTGTVDMTRPEIRSMIDAHVKCKVVVMNWGGSEDPRKEKDFYEWNLFEKVPEKYPEIKVYMGDSISPELKQLRYPEIQTRTSDISIEKAIKIIAKSHLVITGRYHGLVVARALGVPYEAPIWNHKINSERTAKLDIRESKKSIELIIEYIENGNGTLFPYSKWDDDVRNSMIVKVHDKYPNLSIPFIQAFDNRTLYEYIAFDNR